MQLYNPNSQGDLSTGEETPPIKPSLTGCPALSARYASRILSRDTRDRGFVPRRASSRINSSARTRRFGRSKRALRWSTLGEIRECGSPPSNSRPVAGGARRRPNQTCLHLPRNLGRYPLLSCSPAKNLYGVGKPLMSHYGAPWPPAEYRSGKGRRDQGRPVSLPPVRPKHSASLYR